MAEQMVRIAFETGQRIGIEHKRRLPGGGRENEPPGRLANPAARTDDGGCGAAGIERLNQVFRGLHPVQHDRGQVHRIDLQRRGRAEQGDETRPCTQPGLCCQTGRAGGVGRTADHAQPPALVLVDVPGR